MLVDHCDEGVPSLIGTVVTSSRDQLGPGLADRLSIFYGDWESFGMPSQPARLGAIDRLDLIENGVLICGVDRRADSGHADLAQAALDWRSGDIDPVVARTLLERHLDGLYAECRQALGD